MASVIIRTDDVPQDLPPEKFNTVLDAPDGARFVFRDRRTAPVSGSGLHWEAWPTGDVERIDGLDVAVYELRLAKYRDESRMLPDPRGCTCPTCESVLLLTAVRFDVRGRDDGGPILYGSQVDDYRCPNGHGFPPSATVPPPPPDGPDSHA